jgi:hypothetical protein
MLELRRRKLRRRITVEGASLEKVLTRRSR